MVFIHFRWGKCAVTHFDHKSEEEANKKSTGVPLQWWSDFSPGEAPYMHLFKNYMNHTLCSSKQHQVPSVS